MTCHADALSAESGSSDMPPSPLSEQPVSLQDCVVALLFEVRRLTNEISMLVQQNAVLIDVIAGEDEEKDEPTTYLDGSPL